MTGSKADIIAQLRRDIISLQGLKTVTKNTAANALPGPIQNAFPNASFPLGAIHEFISTGMEDAAATSGFVAGLIASMMQANGALIWISACRTIFPPALQSFGISPDRIIFIDLAREKEIMWAMEEALKCKGLSAVIGEMKELSFTASRRLQLAVEKSCVTGFVLRRDPKSINTTACITRWQITAEQSEQADGMPGVGFPCWNVVLQKVRNGYPGAWKLAFVAGRFRHISPAVAIPLLQKKKTG